MRYLNDMFIGHGAHNIMQCSHIKEGMRVEKTHRQGDESSCAKAISMRDHPMAMQLYIAYCVNKQTQGTQNIQYNNDRTIAIATAATDIVLGRFNAVIERISKLINVLLTFEWCSLDARLGCSGFRGVPLSFQWCRK